MARPVRLFQTLWLICMACVAQAQAQARLEWGPLPASAVEAAPDLRTGYLVVPERRHPEPGSRTIRLPFVVMKSRAATPAPDPVLLLAGGPGGSILARARNRARNPLLEDRDVILLEQRGTHFAEPALMAPDVAAALRSGWGTRLNGAPDPEQVRRALATTLEGYRRAGVDLAGYTTRESAADVADLRRLLDLPAWNLFGMSYSTKLVLTVMRDHPEGLRAVVLDSVLPPEAAWDEEAPAHITRTLDRVLKAARADPVLHRRFGDLRGRFQRLLRAADRKPLTLTVRHPLDGSDLHVQVNGQGLLNAVYAALESVHGIRRLPLWLDAACRGDHQALAPALAEYLGSSQGSALGMRLSVWGNEEFPFERPARIRHPRGLPRGYGSFVQTAVAWEAFATWPQGRPDPAEDRPVVSPVPAFIASGEFDPDTPPVWARAVAERLLKAQLLTFRGMSHVPLFTHPEATRLLRAFLAHPEAPLDPGSIGTPLPFLHTLE
jgi:pimeloyl-ACP methyl ester carboxylesterase